MYIATGHLNKTSMEAYTMITFIVICFIVSRYGERNSNSQLNCKFLFQKDRSIMTFSINLLIQVLSAMT